MKDNIEVTLPHLEPYQKDVLMYFYEHPKEKWVITKSPRQVGKSALLAVLLIYASLREGDGWSLCVSPVFAQARKLFEDVCNIAGDGLIKKMNGTALEIKFVNGSVVKFGSAEQGDNLRGYTTKGKGILAVDEFAFIKDKFFYDVLVPITNVHHNDIFLFSTPKFKQGAFYELYTRATSGTETNLKAFDWTEYDLSKYLTEEILDMYRKQLPRLTFLAEYKAEFISGEGSVFPAFKQCVGNYNVVPSEELVLGIDWGTGSGSDYTVITPAQIVGDRICVAPQVAFNDKTPTMTIDYILQMVRRYVQIGCKEIEVIVEKNSIGSVYHSMLIEALDEFETNFNKMVHYTKEIEIRCNTFVTTNQSKKKAVEQLELLFETEKIIIPNDNTLLTQLSLFEAKINSLGNVTYAVFANNQHDDMVMSLLFAIHKLYNDI